MMELDVLPVPDSTPSGWSKSFPVKGHLGSVHSTRPDLYSLEKLAKQCQEAASRSAIETVTGLEKGGRRKRDFLDLPFEIRLQIYSWVHIMHPAQEPELCPWYPTPRYSPYFLAPIVASVFWREGDQSKTYLVKRSDPRQGQDHESAEADKKKLRLLSPHRPIAYIPHALLRTCRQVYEESRALPFRENEFVFITWFSSGLSAARAFLRGLQPWQRAGMRYARLELQARDIGDEGRLAVWEELCGYWAAGMRGLRVKLALDETEPVAGDEGALWWPLGRSAPAAWTRDPFRWVTGLKSLAGLRALEVELVGIKALTDAEMVEWGGVLKDKVNEGRGKRERVSVVCVERVSGVKGEVLEKRKVPV